MHAACTMRMQQTDSLSIASWKLLRRSLPQAVSQRRALMMTPTPCLGSLGASGWTLQSQVRPDI